MRSGQTDRDQKLKARAAGRSRDSEAGMTTFDKREEGFEKKFAVDQELKFKANARRNRLLGLCLLYTSPSPRDS